MREKQKFDSIKDIEFPEYKTTKRGEYIFEVAMVRVLKVGEEGQYGDPYTASAIINILDCEAHVNTLSGEGFTKRCFKTIFGYIKSRGIKVINYKRIKNLKHKFKKLKT